MKNSIKQKISPDLKLERKERLVCATTSSLCCIDSTLSILRNITKKPNWESEKEEEEEEGATTMGGFAMGYTFDSKSGLTMAALLLMIVSFYAGILFGNNAPLYVSQLVSHSSSSSSPPNNVSSNGNNLFTSPQLRTSFFHCFSSYPLLSSCKILKLCHLGFLQNASVCKFPDLYCLFS